ncbi:TerD family protein [Streptomyces avermitilis]|uniref:TerD family protein n=1 Tax=Streptomyces avermitilis TaxID=33903 RepID=UPI003687B21F
MRVHHQPPQGPARGPTNPLTSPPPSGGGEVNFGELYRREDEWKFRSVGQGYDAGELPRDLGHVMVMPRGCVDAAAWSQPG